MKTLIFLTALLITCYGKEYPEETADLFKTKLWQEIQKRLFEKEGGQTDHEANLLGLKDAGNDESNNNVNHSPQCTRGSPNAVNSIVANTIIKTTDSVKSGAAFLASPKIASATECLDKCCQMSHCTLAVYENKKKNACYLFDCGNPTRCQFTDHANYTSIILKPAPRVVQVMTTTVPAAVPVEDHVDALQDLVNKPEAVQPTENQPSRTTQPETTRASALPPTTTVQEIVQVKLFAACSRHEVCEDGNAECSLEQFCVCKDGFTPKNGRCVVPEEPVSHCGRFQFECKNPNSYPRCIASYDRCDGVSQCADGSDEADCSSANKGQDKNKPVPGQAGSNRPDERIRPVETGPGLPIKMQSPRPPIVVITSRPTRPSPKVNVGQTFAHQGKGQPVPNTGHSEVQSHPDKTESQMIHPNQGKIETEVPQNARPQVPKQEKPIETGIQPETKSDLVAPESNVEKSGTKVTDEKEPAPELVSPTQVPKSKPAAAVDHPAANDVQVQAHVEAPDDSGSSFLFYGGSQGAVVALSLSLAITVILVLFLGCRLRTVKRRLKRGRVLTSNEADYLINGMYL